ncbi:hypothetical protein POM88_012433 [Heracleum sosnowskyi]|uniref:K-box domain-containing protein n=1 Tax=Heracleum sosnowskyi TaxID=360622 RepID=A0AAD8N2H0_9APIA|nr:hypothetical protein POM88_012433 [Heracleum sosnowskyi]
MCLIRVVNGKHSVGRCHSSLLKSVVTEIYFRSLSMDAVDMIVCVSESFDSLAAKKLDEFLRVLKPGSDIFLLLKSTSETLARSPIKQKLIQANPVEEKPLKVGFQVLQYGQMKSALETGILIIDLSVFFAVDRIQHRGRRLRHLEGNHSSWQSLPVSTAIEFSSTTPEDSSEVSTISSPPLINPNHTYIHFSHLSIPDLAMDYQEGPESFNNQTTKQQQQEEEAAAGKVALIVFSSRGRLYEYANNSVKSTVDRYYKKASAGSTSDVASTFEATTQFYQQEASRLELEIQGLQNSNRNIVGEGLGSLSCKELKNLEAKLDKAIAKIRLKKNETILEEIEHMQKREIELQQANMFLRAKISENERMRHDMSLMAAGGGGCEDHDHCHQQRMETNYSQSAYNNDDSCNYTTRKTAFYNGF